MPHRMLTLEQAARHIHIDPHELLHLAQREEIPFRKRGEEYFFEHRVVDDWAQRHLLELPPKNLVRQHKEVIIDSKRTVQDDKLIAALMKPEWIDPAMASRTRPGVIRDMVALAQETGLLYDDVIFQQEVEEREKAASTAIGEGAAFLHARYHDPYYAAGSFVILGRTIQPIYFGAKDGLTTDLFFLLCCAFSEAVSSFLSRVKAEFLPFPAFRASYSASVSLASAINSASISCNASNKSFPFICVPPGVSSISSSFRKADC